MTKRIHRRQWLKASAASLLGLSASGWLPSFADRIAADPRRRRHCILLWMTGGPSQTDTFDMKPDHANGGEFREISTNVVGLRFSEHLPSLAMRADKLALVRGLSTKEGDHGRGTFLVRTGQRPLAPVRYPSIGAALAKELSDKQTGVPNYVSIAPYRALNPAAFGPGFLGPRYAPLTVAAADNLTNSPDPGEGGYAELRVDNLQMPPDVDAEQFAKRIKLWRELQDTFLAKHSASAPAAHHATYEAALQVMDSPLARAFDLTKESGRVRDAYGAGRFGQGCLLARRLVEAGVALVEVTLGTLGGGSVGWDTHQGNFPAVKELSGELDAGWATLMDDLQDRGLLEQTTILWIGEFGRTPQINSNAGRDHFPAAWTCVLAGGGIQGGAVHGETSADGSEVLDGRVEIGDVLSTLSAAVGVDPDTENISEAGRPIRIAEGTPIREILTAQSR
jgi:hypothetical protein